MSSKRKKQTETKKPRHARVEDVEQLAVDDLDGFDVESIGENVDPADFSLDDAFSEDSFAYSDEPQERSRCGVKIAVGVIAALLLAVYAGGVVFFSSHFLPKTMVNGVDVSLKAPAEVQEALQASLVDYQLKVDGCGVDLTLDRAAIGYGLDPEVDWLKGFNHFAWPLDAIKGAGEVPLAGIVYNQQAVDDAINQAVSAVNETAAAPVDAHLAYDQASNAVVVAPEEQGGKIDLQAALAKVHGGLDKALPQVTLTSDELVKPAILASDEGLKRAAAQANTLTDVDVTLTLGGFEAARVNRSNLLDWVLVDDNGNAVLQPELVAIWAAQVAARLDTYGKEHTYIRPGTNKVITVEGGDDGWAIDAESLKNTIVEAIHNSTKGTIEIPCTNSGDYYDMNTGIEWRRFVDVDLSEQHAYFFVDGQLKWDTDVITGNVNIPSRETPTGTYYITRMSTNETLYTYEEGKKEPNKTVVSYWMPFIGNVYALHDAWWQPDFGGNMFREGYGSHGCVNLPVDKAAELYDILEVGDTVLVHW